MLLCVLMLLSSMNISALAVVLSNGGEATLFVAEAGDGLCEHHPVHTAECGYIEARGHICTHEHDVACGYNPGSEEIPCDRDCADVDEEGNIIHVEECSYAPAVPYSPCTHEHDRTCGFEPASPCAHQHDAYCGYAEAEPCAHVHDGTCGYVEPTGVAPCTHVHDGTCGYSEATDAKPCAHVHDETCGYAEAAPCIHIHNEACGYVEAVTGVDCAHAHDAYCGYVQEVAGQPCQHQHDEFCGYSNGTLEIPCDLGCVDEDGDGIVDHAWDCAYIPAVPASDCAHTHDGNCGYVQAVAGQPCRHVHDASCGYVQAVKGQPCQHQHDDACGYAEKSDCTHVHDAVCGYAEASEATPCGHVHDGVCGYSEGEGGAPCEHEHDYQCGYAEEIACGHVHDAICGYEDPVEGQPCLYICEICNIIVNAWAWVDPDGNLKPGAEDVAWVLDVSGANVSALLPTAITATLQNGESAVLPITWNLDDKREYASSDAEAQEQTEVYILAAELPEGYALAVGVPALTVLVRQNLSENLSSVVTDWVWLDADENMKTGAEYGVEDVAWVLDALELSDEELAAAMPQQIAATLKTGDTIALPITWDLDGMRKYELPADAAATDAGDAQADMESAEPDSPGEETETIAFYIVTAELPSPYELDASAPALVMLVRVSDEMSYIVTDWLWVDPEENLIPGAEYGLEDVAWILDATGVSEEDLPALLPAAISATTKIGGGIELPIAWNLEERIEYEVPEGESEDALTFEDAGALDDADASERAGIAASSEDADAVESGDEEDDFYREPVKAVAYLLTAELPEGYVLDEAAPALTLLVCENWAYIVTDWTWVDPYEILRPASNYAWVEGVDWVVGLPEMSRDEIVYILPSAIDATVKTGALVEELPITWDFAHMQEYILPEEDEPSDDYAEDEAMAVALDESEEPTGEESVDLADDELDEAMSVSDTGSKFYLLPALVPEEYALGEGAPALTVLVQMTPINPLFEGTDLTPEDLPGALHFIVRNWHTRETSGTFSNPAPSGSWYFVVAEGYIALKNPEDLSQGYEIYMVFRDTVEFTEGDYKGKKFEAGKLARLTSAEDSDYIAGYDETNGSIILRSWPLANEKFLGYSITAGAGTGAITNNGTTITITYDPDVHLVKAHAFYKDIESNGLTGVDGDKEKEFFKDDEHDTAMADYDEGNDSYNQNDEGTIKVYNTAEGLHTDKTATEHIGTIPDLDEDGKQKTDDETGELLTKEGHDGRTFDVQLDVWHSKGFAPWVGMVLDASGSMAFASDVPTPINVNDFDQSVIDQLANKIGFVNENDFFEQEVEGVPFPEYDKLLGYYEILQRGLSSTNAGNYRTWFLNSKKQDPSKFSGVNDYESADRNDFAKVVPQAEEKSGEFDFSEAKQLTLLEYGDYNRGNGPAANWGGVPMKFDNTNGIGLDNTANGEAFFPESQPTGENFSLAFSLNGTTSMGGGSIVEIAYVGGLTGNRDMQDHFYLFRQNNDLIGVMGGYDESAKTLFKISSACSGKHNFVFVFKDDRLYVYMDGALQRRVDVTGLSKERNVIFKPFGKVDSQVDPSTFWLDSIYLFDAPLNSSDIDILNQVAGNALTDKVTVMMGAFLTADELSLLMDPNFTDHSANGTAGYSYFVFDPRNGTSEYVSLGYYKNGSTDAKVLKYKYNDTTDTVTGNGWYYCSYGSWDNYVSTKKITAKTLHGLVPGTYSDTIKAGDTSVSNTGVGAAPDLKSSGGNTDKSYEVSSAGGPAKFYIDAEGYLRCFLGISNNPYTSFVYKLEDSEYVKTETLERAVGAFVTELNEKAPYAKVSAVRFSGEKAGSDDLLMLNWTSEAQDSIGFFTGSTGGNIVSNYNLTGGTYTATGVQAYLDKLDDNQAMQDEAESGAPKYLIIFTDGADNDLNKKNPMPAEAPVDQLKKKGYTIFTVMLNGGAVKAGSGTYDSAKKYLVGLSGTKDTPDDEKKNYFFSSDEARSQLASEGVNVSNMKDSDVLTTIFSNKILNMITEPLEDYIVQDYIDPRFDLVDKDGVVWHLKADGQVVAGNETYDLKNGDRPHILFTNETGIMGSEGSSDDDSDDTGDDSGAAAIAEDDGSSSSSGSGLIKSSPNPYLYYESSKDLYYLRWEGQDIPGCSVGSNLTSIWSRTITIRAKEDFLGGNAVLCDGIKELENYVFVTGDKSPSSGVDRDTPDEVTTGDLSKGFPRVSVNVTPPSEDVELDQTIYMSETLDAKEIASMLIQAGKANADNEAVYYWEYVSRFVNYFNWLIDEGDLEKPAPDEEYYQELLADARRKAEEEGDGSKEVTVPVTFDPKCSIIKTLHIMNRSGNYIPSEEGDSLEDGHIKIISDRILGLMQSGELTVQELSALLVSPDTVIGDKGNHDEAAKNKENYLYIPYIYLPDNPTGQTNATGTDDHKRDVIGYLYFHVTEQYLEKNETESKYPGFPEDGVTKDTNTRKSGLTVSFEVRDADMRKDWNNSQVIAEKDENGKLIYGRDPDYKPAPGTPTIEANRIVINGSFTTYIKSGEVQLQAVPSERLKKSQYLVNLLGKTIKYEAELWRTYTYKDEYGTTKERKEKVGTLEIDEIVKDKDIRDHTPFTATFTPVDDYSYTRYVDKVVNGEDGDEKEIEIGYALPYGTYTLEKETEDVPTGYKFKPILVVSEENLDENYGYGRNGLFVKAEGYDEVTEYIAGIYVDDNCAVLGDREAAEKTKNSQGNSNGEDEGDADVAGEDEIAAAIEDDGDGENEGDGDTDGEVTKEREYTDYRFGLFQVELDIVGDLKISKTVTPEVSNDCDTHKANDEFEFTVTLTAPTEEETEPEPEVDAQDADPEDGDVDAPETDEEAEPEDEVQIYKAVYIDGDGKPVGEEFEIKFTNGKAEKVKLKAGQTILIKDLPAGYKYTVEETNATGYKLIAETDESGEIKKREDEADPATAKFTNRPVHTLTISKAVSGSQGDKNKKWEFVVELKDAGGNVLEGQYDYYIAGELEGTIASGDTVEIKHGQSVVIKDLPCGARYTVTETEANTNGYSTAYTDDGNGKLTRDVTVSYTNDKPKTTVTVTKQLAEDDANEADKNIEFEFVVTVEMPEDIKVNDAWPETYTCKVGLTAPGKVLKHSDGAKYTYTTKLKPDGTFKIEGLPVGAKVSVVETRNPSFECEMKVTKGETPVTDQTPVTVDDDVAISFVATNTRTATALTLSKTVTGNMGNRDKGFEFTIDLGDEFANKSVEFTGEAESPETTDGKGTLSFNEAGKATVKLKHGQSITMALPRGTEYKITEANENYTTTVTVNSGEAQNINEVTGTLSADTSVSYVNDLTAPVPTGVGMDVGWMVPAMAMSCLGLVWLLRRRRRRDA